MGSLLLWCAVVFVGVMIAAAIEAVSNQLRMMREEISALRVSR